MNHLLCILSRFSGQIQESLNGNHGGDGERVAIVLISDGFRAEPFEWNFHW